jgi:serine/threonine-protein kinase RsbW
MKPVEPTVVLRVPAEAEYVDLARLTLYGVASKMGFSYEDIEDMKVAVSEACNNAVLHAYGAAPGVMEIGFGVCPDGLRITVKDDGVSFDSAAENGVSSAPLAGKSIDEIEAGGLGLYLMQALMDEVEVMTRPGAGTEVVLTKRLAKSEEMA